MRIPKVKKPIEPTSSRDDVQVIIGAKDAIPIREALGETWGKALENIAGPPTPILAIHVGENPNPAIDDLLFQVRDKLGCGFAVTVVAPSDNRIFKNSRVCVTWHRLSAMKDKDGGKRVMFTATLSEALRYVLEYERRYDAEGADAARAWHRAEISRRELEMERLIEQARRAREGKAS